MPLGDAGEAPARARRSARCAPVGGDDEVPFDARIVAATNRDLETTVEERRFREDLFYRLNVVQRRRCRRSARAATTSSLLAQHFLAALRGRSGKKDVTGFSAAVARAAPRVRVAGQRARAPELRSSARSRSRASRSSPSTICPRRSATTSRRTSSSTANDPEELVSMDEVERRYILRVLEAVGGNKSLATRILGFDRKTLYRRLERWGINSAD